MGIINANVSSRGRGGLTSEIVFIGDPDTSANAIYPDGAFVKFMTYSPDIKKICSVQVGNFSLFFHLPNCSFHWKCDTCTQDLVFAFSFAQVS